MAASSPDYCQMTATELTHIYNFNYTTRHELNDNEQTLFDQLRDQGADPADINRLFFPVRLAGEPFYLPIVEIERISL